MLNELVKWGQKCGLKFNPEKSVAIMFSRSRKNFPYKLTLAGKVLEYQNSVKYLGVVFDKKCFGENILTKKSAAARGICLK